MSVIAIQPILDALRHPGTIDDRKNVFGDILTTISNLPAGPIATKLNDEAIVQLYNTFPHPPASSLGDLGDNDHFRRTDGGGNNPEWPDLGRSGTPYSRSVKGKPLEPANTLPDPGVVFDELLKADNFQPHPGGFSSLMFAFATLVTLSLFRTNLQDPWINDTSSYLDLSPLYGTNQIEQDSVRDDRWDSLGRGLLCNDCYADERLVFLPPAAGALLVIFCRNHNVSHRPSSLSDNCMQ